MGSASATATASSNSGGIGCLGIIQIILIVLKVIGEQFHTMVADWSWWLVLTPVWVAVALTVFMITAILIASKE